MAGQNAGWKGIPLEYASAWRRIFNFNREGLDLSDPCPICGNRTLHLFYQILRPVDKTIGGNLFVAEGGLWEWCGTCRHYEHLSALVPEWWSCDLAIDISKLTAEPEAIEQAIRVRADVGLRG